MSAADLCTDDPAIRHFHALSRDEQSAAIQAMARDGWSDHGIAHATRLSVEQIRHVLTQRVPK